MVLSEQPLTAETPAHLLDDDTTPAARLFVRNNGDPPPAVDASTWTLSIDGEAVERPLEISLQELRSELRESHARAPARVRRQRTRLLPAVGCGIAVDDRGDRLPALHRRAAA